MDAEPAEPRITAELSEDEEELCRSYGRTRFNLNVAELVVLVVTLAALTFTGAAGTLLRFSHPGPEPTWLGHLVYLVLIGFITRVVLLPIHYLGEHWLDRRFALSRQGFRSWFWEWLCRSAVYGLATVAVLFPVAETLRWWPWLVGLWCVAFLLLRTFFYDHVQAPLMSLFYPVRFLRNECFDLPGVGRMTLPVYQVKVSHKTRRANAGIRLRGDRTAIYVTDTLIDEFTDGEERVVMAHEFGHLYDRLHLETRTRAGIAQAHKKLVYGSVQLLAGALALVLLTLLSPVLGLAGAHDLAGFPLLAALTFTLAHCLSPVLYEEARKDERDADEYALAITGDVENYVSVMRKLRRMNLEEACSSPLSRFLFDTHPSYDERVHLAARYRRRIQRRRKAAPHFRGWRHIQHHGRR